MSIVIQITEKYASEISKWVYEEPYSRYSFHDDIDTINELLNSGYYVVLDMRYELSGYFCFGKSAQIPTCQAADYIDKGLDIGLGMKPTLCGKGNGWSFLTDGLRFARDQFQQEIFRLTVASYNKRAIRLYKKVGFAINKTVRHRISKENFYLMIKDTQQERPD